MNEDPNLPEDADELPEKAETPPALDPNDPEVMAINSQQPTVESGSDNSRPTSYHQNAASPPLPAISPPPSQAFHNPQPTGGDVSPLEPEQPPSDYFPTTLPSVPTFTAGPSSPGLPTAPPPNVQAPPTFPTQPSTPIQPQHYYNQQSTAPPSQPARQHSSAANPFTASSPVPCNFAPVYSEISAEQFVRNDEAVLEAQKHAKWAISALNFDDVDTAVTELRAALQKLGAR